MKCLSIPRRSRRANNKVVTDEGRFEVLPFIVSKRSMDVEFAYKALTFRGGGYCAQIGDPVPRGLLFAQDVKTVRGLMNPQRVLWRPWYCPTQIAPRHGLV